MTLLDVEGLKVNFYSHLGLVRAVRDVSLTIDEGEVLGVVGESGSGKSVTGMAIMGMVPQPGKVEAGTITWDGRRLHREADLAPLRGSEISMIFQDPVASLNPLVPVDRQVAEVLRFHRGLGRREAMKQAREFFHLVGLDPTKWARRYPHELSGGMCQRVMIAAALAPQPRLLIADEPTTALDVTIQAQILGLLRKLRDELGLAIMLITHDLGVVGEMCDRVSVMYAGGVVEEASAATVFGRPAHPYTRGLLESTPQFHGKLEAEPIRGNPPDARLAFPGCPFVERCPERIDKCGDTKPELVGGEHRFACWNPIGSLHEVQG